MPGKTSTRSHAALTWTIVAIAFLVLASGSVAAGAWLAPVSAQTGAAPTAPPSATPEPRPVADEAVPASGIRSCSVADEISDPNLHTVQARVVNDDTGEVLLDRDSDTPKRTASNLKLVTGAAALNTFGPDYRITTPVLEGDEPGTIVLAGRGDLTLTRLPTGENSVYDDAAHLDHLAKKVKRAWKQTGHTEPITRIVLDSSYFGGKTWLPEWDKKGMREGYQSHVTALQVDADRAVPDEQNSPRGQHPITRAGQAFQKYFPNATTVDGEASEDADVLASVASPPMSSLVDHMLLESDNMLGETLARLVAIEQGAGNTFDDLQSGVVDGLQGLGLDTDDLTIADGSGLSDQNAVPNTFFTHLIRGVLDGTVDLPTLLDGLPVSGKTGTLEDRFTGDAEAAVGHVHAKTGWIQTAYTMSGYLDADDGTRLVFSIYALGKKSLPYLTPLALDDLVASIYRCGDDLSNS